MTTEQIKTGILAVLKAIGLAVVGVVTKELLEGQPLAGLAKLKNYQYILASHTPFWALLVALIIIVLLVPYWWRAIREKKPEIHVAWHGSAGWGRGGILQKNGMESVLRIQGAVVITSSFLQESVTITGIILKEAEYAGPYFQMFEVKPGETVNHTLLLNFRGVEPEKGKPFKANLTFLDIKGKRYPLKAATLRAFPGEDVPPTEAPKPKPVVNTGWRFNSWCWARVDRDTVVRIVSEGLMQFTNIPGRIIITKARLEGLQEGLQTVGIFDTFAVEPNEEIYRSISLSVKGFSPTGKVPIKAAIILTDLQGNDYPLREEIFTPYEEPTRWVGGLAWPKEGVYPHA